MISYDTYIIYIYISYDTNNPAIVLLGIYYRKMKTDVHTKNV